MRWPWQRRRKERQRENDKHRQEIRRVREDKREVQRRLDLLRAEARGVIGRPV
jgi:hypothetical protein